MAATSAVVVVIAALSLVALHSRGARADDTGVQVCPDSTTTVPIDISAPGTSVKLQCSSSYTFNPAVSDTTVQDVFCDQACKSPKPLSSLCPGASGTVSANVATLTFQQLPSAPTTVYLQCKGSGKNCLFAVNLKEAPLQGPQACAVKGTTVKLALQGASGTAKFSCGPTLKLKQVDLKKAYKEDCKTEEKLKDLTLTPVENNYYVLAATKSPPTKTLCYLCGDPTQKGREKEDNCTVLISVSAGARLAALSASVLALPCVMSVLHFT